MIPALREHLRRLGREGGRKSRRTLTSEQARELVRVREAGRAYRRFHTQCFWSFDPNLRVTVGEVRWVAERLMTHGGRVGFELGARLCRSDQPAVLPVLEDAEAGYVLHPIDLAVNKLLALVGRNEPRDYLDTLDAHERILPLGGLIWAACGKDPGFTPLLVLDLLERKGRYQPEDFAKLALREPPDLQRAKLTWLNALDAAATFIRSCPPEELGCLYYSPKLAVFCGTLPLPDDAIPHFGRPGGLLPLVG